MTAWLSTFDPELQVRIDALQERGCQFVWRVPEGLTSSAEPLDSGMAWLEIWLHGRLLDFAGPLPQPLDLEGLTTIQEVIEKQATQQQVLRRY
ncbi:hypothetical protein [Deinococcus aquiradiocola]|uniref:Uncharacterized protein n=1 Tax=Deinococcus aquiradiocola TaxID=393059 RepID=A0A917PGG1_9DEIO|nr:hypothetical protein [Deinococcus aquiradiocola]GGJ76874.1 hypothetical protein GCM10008939_21220 [Deinococcus aquiradiocola]